MPQVLPGMVPVCRPRTPLRGWNLIKSLHYNMSIARALLDGDIKPHEVDINIYSALHQRVEILFDASTKLNGLHGTRAL